MNYKEQYKKYLDLFNNELIKAIQTFSNVPKILADAMEYAVGAGGKRIRPILLLATADAFGVDLNSVIRYAVAIECIHSYSLVHDDLPAMDNDDFRRGKLSTHKKFGEAYGILAGDALLNFAFEYVLNKDNFSPKDAKALKLLAQFAGHSGMIAGQVLDLLNENNNEVNQEVLFDIYKNKTAKLLTLPLLIASIFADNANYEQLECFGLNLGIMFQISDDILDANGSLDHIGKTPGKDAKQDKFTSIKVFGYNGALERKKTYYDNCMKQLTQINNSEFLIELTKNIYERNKWLGLIIF